MEAKNLKNGFLRFTSVILGLIGRWMDQLVVKFQKILCVRFFEKVRFEYFFTIFSFSYHFSIFFTFTRHVRKNKKTFQNYFLNLFLYMKNYREFTNFLEFSFNDPLKVHLQNAIMQQTRNRIIRFHPVWFEMDSVLSFTSNYQTF